MKLYHVWDDANKDPGFTLAIGHDPFRFSWAISQDHREYIIRRLALQVEGRSIQGTRARIKAAMRRRLEIQIEEGRYLADLAQLIPGGEPP